MDGILEAPASLTDEQKVLAEVFDNRLWGIAYCHGDGHQHRSPPPRSASPRSSGPKSPEGPWHGH
ncbi:hypothetical protein QQY66_48670 [Streptomyces sp. DG2A-72]|uniref:hypothetical protein n=1 Tax=Streptomyces sp. DG2A-72 TaxID=3051386 RepID=UPI00265C076A|nr:hypothetical protein [Streptomyces sp. DG2A-72]MDO0939193.1 hypothetical protein [Streptomyces sp. DG2A-72]